MKYTLIISFSLQAGLLNRESIVKRIKEFDAWARLGDSAYVILADHEPDVVRDYLSEVLRANDSLFVGKVEAPAAWIGLGDEVSEWLRNNL